MVEAETVTEGILPNVNSIAATAGKFGMYIVYGLLALSVIMIILYFYKQRLIYTYHCRIDRRRADGKFKTIKGKCGYDKKDGLTIFKIKWGFSPRKRKSLEYLPDTSLLDNNVFHFYQLDPETYIQKKVHHLTETVLDKEGKETEIEAIISEPVPRENKVLALTGIKSVQEALKTGATAQTAIIVGGFIILALTFIGAFFILTGTK